MNWLLDKLTKPEILSDGSIRQPNYLMLKAAEVITKLTELGRADRAGRLKAEALNADTDGKFDELAKMEIALENARITQAKAEYTQANNKDYESNLF